MNYTRDNVADLIAKLEQLDHEYHTLGDSSVSDTEYDKLRRLAQQLDPGNAYFASVGSDVRGGKEPLPYTMGSLDQVHDQKEWDNWVDTYDLDDQYVVVSDKQDGISAMLIYRHGLLEKAFSRGNGMEGADITRHVRQVPSVPKDLTAKLGDKAYAAIRSELIMPIAVFFEKYAGTYKNPRNMVAGCFNRSKTDADILADIECITYQVVAHSGIEPAGNIKGADFFPIDTKAHELLFLKALGFLTTPAATVKASTLNDAVLRSLVLQAKKQSKTELDGVVVTINKYDNLDTQRSRTTLNPEHSIKYKVATEYVDATVADVLYEVRKSGFYKPRVELVPFQFGGVTITYASGFNAKFIKDNGIGPGAVVRMTRSGDVIPYIVEVVKPVTPKLPNGGDFDWNETGVEARVKNADDNEKVRFYQVLGFVTSLQVELLKESSLDEAMTKLKLKDKKFDDILWTLFDLTSVEWVRIIGANGKKIYDSLQRRLQNMTYEQFLGAIPHLGFGIGVRKMTSLLNQISYEDLRTATSDDIAALDGFDTKTASQIVAGLPSAMALLDKLILTDVVSIVVVQKTTELKGLNVVFTGFRDSDLEETIEKLGGKIGSSVSSKTTHLLTNDPKSNSGKAKKARDLGVTVMSPEEFKDEYNL